MCWDSWWSWEWSPCTKVIIVGGSIAGLTLAHCLHRANIDHVVLEKRDEIAPQEGASIGLWPNGSQLLDQLGLYEELERQTEPLNRFYDNNFGYGIVFMERQKVLETLYERYPEKSNTHTNKQVVEIRETVDGVCIVTEDGLIHDGSLAVGRMADQDPDHIRAKRSEEMTAQFACVFGISGAIDGLRSGEHFYVYGEGISFMIRKMDRKYSYPDIPRFSTKDAADLCTSQFGHVRITGDVCIRDLWEDRLFGSMTAMEEGISEMMHHGRIVLIGNAARKGTKAIHTPMTLNLGQGANSAMEDAAVLSTILNRLLKTRTTKCQPSDHEINIVLTEFQESRYTRTSALYKRSRLTVRLQSRDDPAKVFLGRYILPYIRAYSLYMVTKMVADGATVGFLPTPGRSNHGWAKYRTKSLQETRLARKQFDVQDDRDV
ncbi:hypothetical protein BJX99DRAFT_245755 [Aspergillus californicus]